MTLSLVVMTLSLTCTQTEMFTYAYTCDRSNALLQPWPITVSRPFSSSRAPELGSRVVPYCLEPWNLLHIL